MSNPDIEQEPEAPRDELGEKVYAARAVYFFDFETCRRESLPITGITMPGGIGFGFGGFGLGMALGLGLGGGE